MKNYRRKLGEWGETLAQQYLLQKGYNIRDRHWQKREGEIDIIAFDQSSSCLVFIEVKTRTSKSYGTPEESITSQKKRKLEAAISLYIIESGYQGDYRFDVIIIQKSGRKTTLKHLKNASLE